MGLAGGASTLFQPDVQEAAAIRSARVVRRLAELNFLLFTLRREVQTTMRGPHSTALPMLCLLSERFDFASQDCECDRRAPLHLFQR
jgi:hypothetical protein